ncbi:hypothetical protein PanWU01x14_118610 [Parasponia andersonii]|uniref:Uncharacterized protein n=1 Tax=Parasponia andersonii TaxID=3476 RepID=A0A2P5CVU0_PARAD|nr:hypothetical protein PanWU01x14_118610 [Parasponia andersonii]
MNRRCFFEIQQQKPVGVNFPLRKIQHERVITSQAKRAGDANHGVKNGQTFGDGCGPAEEYIGDDAEWLAAMVFVDELLEDFLEESSERSEGFCKADDRVAAGRP